MHRTNTRAIPPCTIEENPLILIGPGWISRHAYDYKILDKQETQEATGTEACIGSLMNMGNGHLHPLNMCIGEANAAVSQGASIYEQSPVLTIEKSSRPKVITDQGSVSADF